MSIQTQQVAINVAGTSMVALPAGSLHQFLYIKNYTNIPGTSTPQTAVLYVAFGKVATAGTAGEIEIVPGVDFVWGGNYETKNQNQFNVNCPIESINVIASGGTAQGCIMVFNVV